MHELRPEIIIIRILNQTATVTHRKRILSVRGTDDVSIKNFQSIKSHIIKVHFYFIFIDDPASTVFDLYLEELCNANPKRLRDMTQKMGRIYI